MSIQRIPSKYAGLPWLQYTLIGILYLAPILMEDDLDGPEIFVADEEDSLDLGSRVTVQVSLTSREVGMV